ncbi:MAG TPA: trypsin-like serine protease [Pseudonocardiaceae bacterium]|nr:trypsin-like serine protease [Pseudonocardiaceae bacterium]
MNKLVSAALIGGAALAVGLLPSAQFAQAATAPTPIPNPAAPTAPSSPGGTGQHAPGQHVPGQHVPGHGRKPVGHPAPGHQPPTHKPVHKAPVHKTPVHKAPVHKAPVHKPGKRKTVGHQPGPGQPGSGGSTGTPPVGPGRPVPHPPVVHPPVVQPPVVQPPVAHQPVGKPGLSTQSGPTTSIIGGGNATNAPWAAQVYWDDLGFECSGTLVAARWVLTAGHCVTDGGMTVKVGSLRLGGGTAVTIDDKQLDPAGDLALLHLAEPVQAGYVQLADTDPAVGSTNEIYGWGKTSSDSGPARQLRTAKVQVTDLDCVDGKQGKAICSTGVDGTAYNGDSGGPEMADGVEVGVCSTGDEEAKSQQYASVAAGRDWIRQTANV